MWRIVLGVIAAFAANFAVVLGGESLGHAIWPVSDADQATMVAHMPLAAKLVVVAAWGAGALAAAAAAVLVSRRGWMAWVGASVTLLGVVANAFSFPHPAWMIAAGIVLPVLAGFAASRMIPWRSSRR